MHIWLGRTAGADRDAAGRSSHPRLRTRSFAALLVLTAAVAALTACARSPCPSGIAGVPEESGPANLTAAPSAGAAERRPGAQQPQEGTSAGDDTTLKGLKDLQLSEGPPSPGFMMNALAGRLPEGDVVLSPAFDSAATDYTADVTQETVTLRLSAAPGATIEVTGAAADGTRLPVVNRSYLGDVNNAGRALGSFASMTLSGLTAGANTMEVAVTAADETAKQGYTLVVTRTAAR